MLQQGTIQIEQSPPTRITAFQAGIIVNSRLSPAASPPSSVQPLRCATRHITHARRARCHMTHGGMEGRLVTSSAKIPTRRCSINRSPAVQKPAAFCCSACNVGSSAPRLQVKADHSHYTYIVVNCSQSSAPRASSARPERPGAGSMRNESHAGIKAESSIIIIPLAFCIGSSLYQSQSQSSTVIIIGQQQQSPRYAIRRFLLINLPWVKDPCVGLASTELIRLAQYTCRSQLTAVHTWHAFAEYRQEPS